MTWFAMVAVMNNDIVALGIPSTLSWSRKPNRVFVYRLFTLQFEQHAKWSLARVYLFAFVISL